jgi:hypothetical protein
MPFSLGQEEINPIVQQGQTRKLKKDISEADKWMPYFSGFPKDTIFGASDVTSELWGRLSLGFFQVGHLFSNLDAFCHIMQLSFFTRRAIRHSTGAVNPSNQTVSASTMYSLLPSPVSEISKIHDSLVLWYENLPSNLRLWQSLEVLVSDNFSDLSNFYNFKDGERLGSVAVLLNLLFFATISILHQKNADDVIQLGTSMKFRISSSLLYRPTFHSSVMLRIAYRGQVFLLRKVYGQYVPPQPTTIPPSEMVGSSMISCLLMPTATALLGQETYASKLLQKVNSGCKDVEDPSGVDPLEAIFLPVLENIGQVWSISHLLASTLRTSMNGVASKIDRSASIHQMWEKFNGGDHSGPVSFSTSQASLSAQTFNLPVTEQNILSVNDLTMPFAIDAVENRGQGTEKSWRELRNEFEDEFLL